MNRSWRFVLALAAVLVVVVLVAGNPDDDPGAPLSPDGTGPSGAKATVLLLEDLGAEVDVVREDQYFAPNWSGTVALARVAGHSRPPRTLVHRFLRGGHRRRAAV